MGAVSTEQVCKAGGDDVWSTPAAPREPGLGKLPGSSGETVSVSPSMSWLRLQSHCRINMFTFGAACLESRGIADPGSCSLHSA